MSLDEGAHPVAVRTRVVAQRPADRLADEELRVLLVGLDDAGEQVEVRIGRVLELANDGAAPYPHVRIGGPHAHAGRRSRVLTHHQPDGVGGLINQIPPLPRAQKCS